MCFAPFLNTLRPLDPNLNFCQFSRFLICRFWPFDHRNVDDFSFVSTKTKFQKVSSYNSFRNKNVRLTRIILFPTAILVFSPNFPYIDLWANFHLWVYCRIFYGPRNVSSKSMESQLSNALSNAFIALLVAEISSFQFQKLPQYPPLCSVFIHTLRVHNIY